MTARAPLGAPAVWLAVVDRDGGQCTCTGGCGRRHRDTRTPTANAPAGHSQRGRGRGPGANAIPPLVERCPAGTRANVEQLLAVPVDPSVPDTAGWKLPLGELTTRCPDCAARAARRARTLTPLDEPTAAPTGTTAQTTPTTAPERIAPANLLDLLDAPDALDGDSH